jgi:sterol desaturase/sphingolipid hydroxylase (fatty acid hydroxylase superfamily)
VHHSSNLKYLDKNHGEVFIFWDRLFGTFQQEEETCQYGLTTKERFKNSLDVEFSEWQKTFHRLKNAGSVKNIFNYLIQPPG